MVHCNNNQLKRKTIRLSGIQPMAGVNPLRHAAYPWLLILPVLAVLLGLATALPVQLRIVYEGKGGEHRLHLWMGILNWRLGVHADYPSQPECHGDQGIRIKRSLSKRKGNAGRFSPLAGKRGFRMMMQQRRLRGVLANFRGSIVVLKQYLRHSVCNRLFWETSLGFDDHAATGLACGLCWAGKGMIIGALSR